MKPCPTCGGDGDQLRYCSDCNDCGGAGLCAHNLTVIGPAGQECCAVCGVVVEPVEPPQGEQP
jgi:hypothetical protein